MGTAVTAPNLAGLSVLIVDDDIDMARLIDAVLRDMGVSRIDRARDGAQAIVKLRKNLTHYDLIISDWEMPEVNGLQLLQEIRKRMPDLPFLMLTVRANAGEILAAKQAQVTGYITKPFTPLDLQKKVFSIFCPTVPKKEEDVFLIC